MKTCSLWSNILVCLLVSTLYKKTDLMLLLNSLNFCVTAEVFTPPNWSQSGQSLMHFVDRSLNVLVCSSCLAHNAAQLGEMINFLDGLAINSERGFLACIHLPTLGLCDIDL